jgi:membrane-bound lytic murein transglycosylase D
MKKRHLAIVTIILFVTLALLACSHPDPERLMRADTDRPARDENHETSQNPITESDETPADALEIDREIDRAEYYYARAVAYFHQGILDSAQQTYEQALEVLSEIDIAVEDYPDQAVRIDRLLNEIEQDFRLTLMSTGVLYSQSSVAAFRELFEDVKNFKKLKESDAFRDFDRADTVIYDIPIEWNDRVENSLAYLQTVAREAFATYLERSGRYMPMVEKVLAEHKLPHDLAYLPLIESGFNPHAYSYARAVGMWQFISATGRTYGLRHNWWYDQRRDFEKSTEAAARHLKDLYNQFGSWNLALAAYNAGAGRISREIRKKKTKDFWKLRPHKQTMNYVPLFMAATIIAKQPEKYGFYPDYESVLEFDRVEVSKCISFKNISAKTGIPVSDLELLNPELRRGVTPPDIKNYSMRVPVGYSERFVAAYDDIPSEKNTNWVRHKIRRGETVSTIARRYGVSMASIVQANSLGRKKRIYAGKTLTIPIPPGKTYPGGSKGKGGSKNRIKKSTNGKYLVRYGDTLWDIAVAHGVAVSALKRINRLSSNRIYAGRELIIPDGKGGPTDSNADFIKYKVRRGDNLWRIAKAYKTTVGSIKRANGLVSNEIYPGMVLMVPTNSSSDTRYTYSKSGTTDGDYVVYAIRRGDTLWKIAKDHNVDIGNLARWNNISSKSRLYPGDKLKIYLK